MSVEKAGSAHQTAVISSVRYKLPKVRTVCTSPSHTLTRTSTISRTINQLEGDTYTISYTAISYFVGIKRGFISIFPHLTYTPVVFSSHSIKLKVIKTFSFFYVATTKVKLYYDYKSIIQYRNINNISHARLINFVQGYTF